MRRWWSVIFVMGCAHEPLDTEQPTPEPKPNFAPAPAPIPVTRVERLSPTAAKLAAVKTFALGGVGITGAPNEGEQLALQLAHEPGAVAMFEKLAMHDNRVARLYAYWALRTLDPTRARTHEATLMFDDTTVDWMTGCLDVPLASTNEVFTVVRDGWRAPMPAP